MSKVAIYVRVSTTGDKQDYTRQINELKAIAYTDKYIDDQIDVFADSISGYTKKDNRPELSKMLDNIENDNTLYDRVYVAEISRIGRNPSHVRKIIDDLTDMNIPIYIQSLKQATIVNGQRNFVMNIVLQVLMEFANSEAETFKIRSKSGLLQSAKNGKVGGGLIYAYGYKNENQFLVVDKEEAIIVREIFDLYKAGNGSKFICNHLNKNNVPTRLNKVLEGKTLNLPAYEKNASSIKWSDTQVLSILKNTIYKGERNFKGQVIPIQGIVSKELFDECTKIRQTKTHRNFDIKYDYLLKDLLVCGCCNRNYFAKFKPVQNGDKVYICSSRLKLKGSCGNIGVNISYLESVVYDTLISNGILAKRIQNKASMLVSVRNDIVNSNDVIANFNIELLQAFETQKRIQQSFFKGKITEKVFDENISEVEKEIDNLNKKLSNYEEKLTSSKKLLSRLQTKTSSDKFFSSLKNNRKQVIQVFKEYIDTIVITKMNDRHVYAEIFLSIDGKRFDDSVKVFLDMTVPRKKKIIMTYDVAVNIYEHDSFDSNSYLTHIKKGSITDIFNNHETVGYDKKTQMKFKIDTTQRFVIPVENIFKLNVEQNSEEVKR